MHRKRLAEIVCTIDDDDDDDQSVYVHRSNLWYRLMISNMPSIPNALSAGPAGTLSTPSTSTKIRLRVRLQNEYGKFRSTDLQVGCPAAAVAAWCCLSDVSPWGPQAAVEAPAADSCCCVCCVWGKDPRSHY